MAGDLEAILGGNSRMALRPGHLIGDVSAYSGLASPADVVARGPGILAKWDLQHVREFTASRPELRANLLRIVSIDLAAKLRECRRPLVVWVDAQKAAANDSLCASVKMRGLVIAHGTVHECGW
jgi:hypothetical protein